jgi:hypothetical protein
MNRIGDYQTLSDNSTIAVGNASITNNTLIYKIKASENCECSLRIVDILGRSIEAQIIQFTAGVNNIEIDLSNYSDGMYLLNIYQNYSIIKSDKFIINK